MASRLLQYEVWNRLNGYGLAASHGEAAQALLGRVAMIALEPGTLARALDPFPVPVRTLDALHLASVCALRDGGLRVRLATYDERMLVAAKKMKLPLYELD